LEQIQFLLGHASVQTTERYLGCKQNIGHPVNDLFDLSAGVKSEKTSAQPALEAAVPAETRASLGIPGCNTELITIPSAVGSIADVSPPSGG
jgi:hypothetical protein